MKFRVKVEVLRNSLRRKRLLVCLCVSLKIRERNKSLMKIEMWTKSTGPIARGQKRNAAPPVVVQRALDFFVCCNFYARSGRFTIEVYRVAGWRELCFLGGWIVGFSLGETKCVKRNIKRTCSVPIVLVIFFLSCA